MVVATPPPPHVVVLGRSVQGRQIAALEVGDPASPRKVLVVGSIHGNETAGVEITRLLARRAAPAGVDLWIVPVLNPDGVAAGRRQNARGVDLNRNFPFAWRPLDRRGGAYWSGPRALSEPESRLAYRLIERIRPRVSIWFHQHMGVVDESGGSAALERRFATLVRLPLRRLQRYPGSATSWQNHAFPGTTAFVVEFGVGRPRAGAARRFADAVLQIAR